MSTSESTSELTLPGVARVLRHYTSAHADHADIMEALTRIVEALAQVGPDAETPETPSLHQWACAILGHDWVTVDDALDVPYCLYCETEQPLPDAKTPLLILLTSAVGADQRGWFEATVKDGRTMRIVRDGRTGTTTYALLLEAAIAALETVPAHVPVTFWAPSESFVNPIQRGYLARWAAAGWRTQKGNPVAHGDLWQHLMTLLHNRPVDAKRVTAAESAHMARAIEHVRRSLPASKEAIA